MTIRVRSGALLSGAVAIGEGDLSYEDQTLYVAAGGVVTIVVFAIMLTERLVGTSIRQTSRFLINGALLSAAVFVGVVGFLVQMPPSGARGLTS